MSELTKARITDGFVDFSLRVPEAEADKVQAALRAILALLPESAAVALVPDSALDDAAQYSPEAVFGPWTSAAAVRGYRLREGLTQAVLAKALGLTRSIISDLETGRRPVSKAMARQLGAYFKTDYKLFL